MNKKGFTLVELLATVVILSIVVGFTIMATNGGFGKAKKKTEDIFIKTIEDALNIYIDSDAKKLSFYSGDSYAAEINKRFGKSRIYYMDNGSTLKFNAVINSDLTPLTESDMVNPANEKECKINGYLKIFRDEEYIYYYYINKSEFDCFTDNAGSITNLPCAFFDQTHGYIQPERCN